MRQKFDHKTLASVREGRGGLWGTLPRARNLRSPNGRSDRWFNEFYRHPEYGTSPWTVCAIVVASIWCVRTYRFRWAQEALWHHWQFSSARSAPPWSGNSLMSSFLSSPGAAVVCVLLAGSGFCANSLAFQVVFGTSLPSALDSTDLWVPGDSGGFLSPHLGWLEYDFERFSEAWTATVANFPFCALPQTDGADWLAFSGFSACDFHLLGAAITELLDLPLKITVASIERYPPVSGTDIGHRKNKLSQCFGRCLQSRLFFVRYSSPLLLLLVHTHQPFRLCTGTRLYTFNTEKVFRYECECACTSEKRIGISVSSHKSVWTQWNIVVRPMVDSCAAIDVFQHSLSALMLATDNLKHLVAHTYIVHTFRFAAGAIAEDGWNVWGDDSTAGSSDAPLSDALFVWCDASFLGPSDRSFDGGICDVDVVSTVTFSLDLSSALVVIVHVNEPMPELSSCLAAVFWRKKRSNFVCFVCDALCIWFIYQSSQMAGGLANFPN